MNANNYTLKCPECNELVARDPRGLAAHRRFKHGITGKSKSAAAYREAKAEKQPNPNLGRPKGDAGEVQCPECRGFYKTEQSLAKHRDRMHHISDNIKKQRRELAKTTQNAALPISTPNGNHPSAPAPDDRDHRIEAAATFASGRIAQLLESLALEYDLPYKPFAAVVLRTIAATAQIRQ